MGQILQKNSNGRRWWFGLRLQEGHGNFGSSEEFAAFVQIEDVLEHAMGGAGNEIADVFVTEEKGHGVAVGVGCLLDGEGIAFVVFDAIEIFIARVDGGEIEEAMPGLGAALKGFIVEVLGLGLEVFGFGFVTSVGRGCGRVARLRHGRIPGWILILKP